MIEHVEEQRCGELLVQPSGLTHAARPKQKKTLPRRRVQQSWIHKSLYHAKRTWQGRFATQDFYHPTAQEAGERTSSAVKGTIKNSTRR
jgi:hypothetical protein